MPFRILTVCTGNICRSPQAEQLLRLGLSDADADIEISSAGTYAHVHEGMDADAAALSTEYGADPTGHAPRQLTKQIVEESDLILALAREHRSAVAKLSPKAARRTFTLRELARIVRGLSSDARSAPHIETSHLEALVAQAAQHRGLHASTPEHDDVVDPYRRSEATYRLSIEQIAPATKAIVDALNRVR